MKKRNLLLGLLALVLTGCNNSTFYQPNIVFDDSTSEEISDISLGVIINTYKNSTSTSEETSNVLYDLRPTEHRFRASENFEKASCADYVADYITGVTKDNFNYSTDAFATDPNYGYIFGTSGGSTMKNIDISGDDDTDKMPGTATALCGRLTGVDEGRYVWREEGVEVTDAFHQHISGMSVYIKSVGENKKSVYTNYQNIAFANLLTENNGGYDFELTFTEPLTDIRYITISFILVDVNYSAEYRNFSLTELKLLK